MKHYSMVLSFTTEQPEEVINITRQCEDVLVRSGIEQGLALIFPLHTSSCVFISDSDTSVAED